MYVVFMRILRKSYQEFYTYCHVPVRDLQFMYGTWLQTGRFTSFPHTQVTTNVVMSVYNKAIRCCSRLTVDVAQVITDGCLLRVQMPLNHSNGVPAFFHIWHIRPMLYCSRSF
jgi:hypothetical protein